MRELRRVDADGEIYYTRFGRFHVNAYNDLEHSSGRLVEPAIIIPSDFTSIRIGSNGSASVYLTEESIEQQAGQFQLARFINDDGLVPKSGDCFAVSDASGPPMTGNPGQVGLGVLQQGWLASSSTGIELWLRRGPFALMTISAGALLLAWLKRGRNVPSSS